MSVFLPLGSVLSLCKKITFSCNAHLWFCLWSLCDADMHYSGGPSLCFVLLLGLQKVENFPVNFGKFPEFFRNLPGISGKFP